MLSSTPATQERFAITHASSTEILAESPKKQFIKAMLDPLWRTTITQPEKVFLNLSLLEEKINALRACAEDTFFAEAAIFLEHFYKSQRRCIWFMDIQQATSSTDMTPPPQMTNDDYHQYAPWIDVVKLTEHVLQWRVANAETNNLMELKECNTDIIDRIEVCLTVVQPFTLTAIALGEEKPETAIKRHIKAVDILSELKLASYEDVFYFAKKFIKYFDKTKLLHECIAIFGMPAQEAIEAFKRLFLSMQLLILIVLKALNQTSNNAMASNSEWIKFKRLIDEFVILDFAVVNNGEDVVGILLPASFSQKNLLLSMLESENLMAELTSRNLHASSRRDRDCQLRAIGLVYISAYNKLTSLITKLNANSVIADYKPVLPEIGEYVLKVMDETRAFFHEHLIKDAFYHFALLQAEREAREKEFCSILSDSCNKIAPILQKMLSSQTIDPVLLQEFGLTQTIDKIIIKQGKTPAKHGYINIESLIDFFNVLNQIELSDPSRSVALQKDLIALHYMEIAFNYCIDYDTHRAAHEECLSKLKDKICLPKASAAKTKSKPRKPDQPPSPASNSQASQTLYPSIALPLAEDQSMLKRAREQELQDLHRLRDQVTNKNIELERNAASAKKGKIPDKVFFPDFAQRAQEISASITALAAKMKTTVFTNCNSQAIHGDIVQVELKLTKLVANQRCAANYFYPQGEEKTVNETKDEALRSPPRQTVNGSFFKNGKPASTPKHSRPTENKRFAP